MDENNEQQPLGPAADRMQPGPDGPRPEVEAATPGPGTAVNPAVLAGASAPGAPAAPGQVPAAPAAESPAPAPSAVPAAAGPSWRLVTVLLLVAALLGGAVGGVGTSLALRGQQPGQWPAAGLHVSADGGPRPLAPPDDWTADEINTWTIAQQAAPSVVQIQTEGPPRRLTTRDGRPLPPWMQPDGDADDGELVPHGIGSGFVLDTDGHIVTNHHVVEGANNYKVVFADGYTVPAELLGSDRLTDLAVLKIDVPPERLQPLTLADSDEVMVGQKAIAIGSPMVTEGFGLGRSPTVTQGIVSAKDRSLAIPSETDPTVREYQIDNLIQTDAALNPGNSGGPLLDSRGRVIGVNTAVLPTAQGIGFAVPSNTVRTVAPQLIAGGAVQRAALGITYQGLDRLKESLGAAFSQLNLPSEGALVVTVNEGGAADQAGIRGGETDVVVAGTSFRLGGDVIIAVDDVKIHGDNLADEILRRRPGDTVTLTILRDGVEQQVTVTLGQR